MAFGSPAASRGAAARDEFILISINDLRRAKGVDRLQMTKQRRWQLRQIANGASKLCGLPRVNAQYCLRHAVEARGTDI